MLTIEEIKAMSPEDLENYNTYLGKKLMKRLAIQAAITTVVVVGINIIARKLESKIDNIEE